jgi:steroid delta-isomerase
MIRPITACPIMTDPAMPRAVLQFFAASRTGDLDGWAASFAEDALFHDPVGQPPHRGRAAIRAFLGSVVPGFDPFLGLTPLAAYTVGGSVAVSWRGAAVTRAGRPVNWAGINVCELGDDGLIQEARAYFDLAVFQAQLTG